MKNPLNRRLPRELRQEAGKYLVIFLFMTLTISIVSGFLVAGNSMIAAYQESFEKYQIEDGHFVLDQQANQALVGALENAGVTLYPDFYLEEKIDHDLDGTEDSTLRIFAKRDQINLVCLMKGEMPTAVNEIAIDRMYADNNGIKTGDTVVIAGKEYTVSGQVALSDYSALFSDNTDMMFDSVKFGVAIMTQEGLNAVGDPVWHYQYSWKYQEKPANEAEEQEQSETLISALGAQILAYKLFGKTLTVRSFVPRYANQAIQFTGDDLGSDRSMVIVLLYILIVIMAFIFSVTIQHTVQQEASVIGTLRASGYTKRELLRHYMTAPMAVTAAAALIGNLLGYSIFKDMVAGIYYGSYSLPTYVTLWNGNAFVLTTIVPLALMLLIVSVTLWSKLALSPLRFLRRDLARHQRKKALRLPAWSFFSRFRLRIILQNISGYITLFIGIFFANVLLLFGMMMSPLLKHYQQEIIDNMIAQYQYILTGPVETDAPGAEKYSVTSLQMPGENGEEITIYGIQDNSAYVHGELAAEGVSISEGFGGKYGIHPGDTLTLHDRYSGDEYAFEVESYIDYPAALAVFMPTEEFCRVFDQEEDYFNGYFSSEEIADIPELSLVSCITEDDLTKVSRQLTVSMGSMFYILNVFAVIMFLLLMYLLTKLIIEKNKTSISMTKILGYQDKEIASLYLTATTWVVIVSLLISEALATLSMSGLYRELLKDYSGWMELYINPVTYVEMFFIGLLSYAAVAATQMRRIRRVPLDEALKNQE